MLKISDNFSAVGEQDAVLGMRTKVTKVAVLWEDSARDSSKSDPATPKLMFGEPSAASKQSLVPTVVLNSVAMYVPSSRISHTDVKSRRPKTLSTIVTLPGIDKVFLSDTISRGRLPLPSEGDKNNNG